MSTYQARLLQHSLRSKGAPPLSRRARSQYFLAITMLIAWLATILFAGPTQADDAIGSGARAFAQLEQTLPTPNVYRTASGAPGNAYWQQQADYKISVSLDEANHSISAKQTVRYQNNSPDTLSYLWLQLDQNRFAENSLERRSKTTNPKEDRISFSGMRQAQSFADNVHGYQDLTVTDTAGTPMTFTVVDTTMRLDLSKPLGPGQSISFAVSWQFNIIEEAAIGGRGGYENFPANDSQIFFLAQWFPRLVAYTDYAGWQHKAFLGRGEFTLEFGDYEVAITVPKGHVVSATGELKNAKNVLSATQRKRLASVNAQRPTFIVTPDEALANETATQTDGNTADADQTWRFEARNVRDFAWASSRKFIWDAMLHEQPGAEYPEVLAMSFYPNEAEPIWSQYSTQAVVHTMDVYSRFSFDYPYPTAQSVNTWEFGGMEYPMITFNGYRPTPAEEPGETAEDEAQEQSADTPEQTAQADESASPTEPTYSRRIKYGLIGVIIHEIGHIYFPMVVNSDERTWTWMDEGINTFLEYVAELEWEEQFPAFRGKVNLLDYIPDYMVSSDQVPIMTQSDSILQFGPNAYSKPAAALTVLRETVMGRELFDFAFKQYSQRWKFKRPTPADFFRTMEDASGVDLDWFWRGWFYSTDHVDLGIADIREYRLKSQDPEQDFPLDRKEDAKLFPDPIMQERNRAAGVTPRLQRFPELSDFYNENDKFVVSNADRNSYQSFLEGLDDWQRTTLDRALAEDPYFYFIDFINVGGLVSPLPLTLHYADGTSRSLMLPAEIWRRDATAVTHMIMEAQPLIKVTLDDAHQTADADFSNNSYPPEIRSSRLTLYKYSSDDRNLMADMLVELKESKDQAHHDAEEQNMPIVPSPAP